MEFILRLVLDVALLVGIIFAIRYALRVEKQLVAIRNSRADMERFVHDFNATVVRAEAGIRNLKNVARDAGDDLEKLTERAALMRDDLKFVYEQADSMAERITHGITLLRQSSTGGVASGMGNMAGNMGATAPPSPTKTEKQQDLVAEASRNQAGEKKNTETVARSRAEMELLRVIEKLK
ncbi:MAG: hypothetical protein EBQ89_10260 [Alphaproteobacteria bacterium]|nr:hypothetical protein [Alphaproteobacteria bacterium]